MIAMVTFFIRGYKDTIECEVVPLTTFHLLWGDKQCHRKVKHNEHKVHTLEAHFATIKAE